MTAAPSATTGVAEAPSPLHRALGRLPSLLLWVATGIAFVTAPQWLSPADEYTAGLVVIAVLLAVSYNLLLGTTGMVSFGHAGFYGIGAFTVALVATKTSGSAIEGLIVSPLVGAASGLLLGAFCLRAARLYFSLLTLAVSQLLYVIAFEWYDLTGGDNGIHGIPVPDVLNDATGAYRLVLAVVAGAIGILWIVTRSPFGSALRGIRENRHRAAFVGLSVKLYELAAFSLASSMAALAGALYAVYDQQAYPGLMFWTESASPIVMVLIGGMRSFGGPVAGAVFYTVLASRVRNSTDYWELIIGGIVLAMVLVLPDGLAGVPGRLQALWAHLSERGRPAAVLPEADHLAAVATAVTKSVAPARAASISALAAGTDASPILEVEGLGRSFGDLRAVDGVDLRVARGSVHAVIGPNGAGKSTLFNLVSGMIRPDRGVVRFEGRDVTGASASRLAHAGMGRAFQTTSIFGGLTVEENVRLAIMAIRGDCRRPVGRVQGLHRERVEEVLESVGLAELAGVRARELSHGDQRALELAISLALDARLLLLDEPTAGMSPYETRRSLELLRRITAARGVTLLLTEHDMDVVFGIAERVTVMTDGRVLVEGTPEDVRRHPDVIHAYLGDES